MNDLENLKSQADLIEAKAMCYYNDLGDEEAYKRLKAQLDDINAKILDLMVYEQEKEFHDMLDKFEKFLDAKGA